MDDRDFDNLIRRFHGGDDRRGLLSKSFAALAAAAFAVSQTNATDFEAKGKNKKKKIDICLNGQDLTVPKKKAKKFFSQGATNGACSPPPPPAPPSPPPPPVVCPGQIQCPPGSEETCCDTDFAGCCTPAQGGGCCPTEFPQCCTPGSDADCCAVSEACCAEATGPLSGCCPSDEPVCCPANSSTDCCFADEECCPNTSGEGYCKLVGGVCCDAEAGGGSCEPEAPFCCPEADGWACCAAEGDCCVPGSEPSCEPGFICEPYFEDDSGGCCVPENLVMRKSKAKVGRKQRTNSRRRGNDGVSTHGGGSSANTERVRDKGDRVREARRRH